LRLLLLYVCCLRVSQHPDKNKAPEAEEAFKVVNSAFQTLSDANKRAHYDAYGEDEPQGGRAPARGGGGGFHQQYDRGDDFSPEDIFNAFFSGQFNAGPAGGNRRTYTFRRQAQQQQQRQQQEESPAAFFQQIMHVSRGNKLRPAL